MATTASRHRRRLLLLCLLLLPCTAVVVLGVRTLMQERELVRNGIEEDRQAVGQELGMAIEAHLETLRTRAGTVASRGAGGENGPTGAVILVAPIVDGALRLPWDGPAQRRRAERFRSVLADGRIRRGETLELVRHDPEAAVEAYREILGSRSGPSTPGREAVLLLEAYARLLLSRALRASGRVEEAREHERIVLGEPATVADEHGVPLALYVAHRWAADDPDEVRRVLGDMVNSSRWFSPEALYLMWDLRNAVGPAADGSETENGPLEPTLERRIAEVEHVLSIARDLPALEARWGAERSWVVHGSEPWLAGRGDAVGPSPPFVLVVDAGRLLDELTRTGRVPDVDDLALTTTAGPSTVPLTPVSGLHARFDAPDDPLAARRLRWQTAFLGSSVLAVVGLAVLGAWLLWRDVQREMRLASLRSAFVSSVSHELRTPLAAIRMFADIMRERPRDEGDPEGEYVETIAGEGERLTRLLDNVLDFARIERGQKRYRPAPTALADVARGAQRTLRYLLEKDHFELRVDLDDDLPLVMVDRDAVEQAILNLLTNAMKYSGTSRSIELRVGRRNGHAVIEVADRGVGIAPEAHARIFDEFYRVPGPEPDAVPGTGLGLTVVRHVAEGHGGFVTVDSAPSEGSRFAIHIPLDRVDHGSAN